jgi:hypothetical protein
MTLQDVIQPYNDIVKELSLNLIRYEAAERMMWQGTRLKSTVGECSTALSIAQPLDNIRKAFSRCAQLHA